MYLPVFNWGFNYPEQKWYSPESFGPARKYTNLNDNLMFRLGENLNVTLMQGDVGKESVTWARRA